MIILTYRHKFAPFTLTTVLKMRSSPVTAVRVELLALDGTIIGGLYMYSDDERMYNVLLEDINK